MWMCTRKADSIPPESTTKISTKTTTVTFLPYSMGEAVRHSRNTDSGHRHIQVPIP